MRDELGADAAIIGNRRIAGGVELTAALDYKLSALAPRVPNVELEEELRKTHTRIATAKAELDQRPDSSDSNRQLFAGQSLTAAEPLVEPHVDTPQPAATASSQASVDPRLFDAMRSELTGLRELLEVQLG
ncbi:MAG TPA: flagellar biosynthesis protein FlhF, partial [Pseudomonas sp.]|nr:flagellar biosynthesis protein FlhF [Pseudomonas sp.]